MIGSVCVVDKESSDFSEADQPVLEHLASIVMDEPEKRD